MKKALFIELTRPLSKFLNGLEAGVFSPKFLHQSAHSNLLCCRIDDAVGATCVHGFGGAWGMLAVGLFAAKDDVSEGAQYNKNDGVLHGERA